MKVLGIDPGLTRCGFGIVSGAIGQPLAKIDVGVITSSPDTPLEQRLAALDRSISELIAQHQPEAVAIERVFSQHNVRTVMGTAQASGVAMAAAAKCGLAVATYTPSEVKAAVSGSGRADKKQVTLMVTRVLNLAEAPKPADAADALALAICHIWRGGATNRLAAAVAAQKAAHR